MQKVESIRGTIIRSYESKENDLVLKVLSLEYGKIVLLGKHGRKSRKGLGRRFDLFDSGTFDVLKSNSSLRVVTRFNRGVDNSYLLGSLERLAVATTIAEASDLLLDEDSEVDPNFYRAFDSALKELATANKAEAALRILFDTLLVLLSSSGILDNTKPPKRSSKALEFFIAEIEKFSEREMHSKQEIFAIIKKLPQVNSGEEGTI